MHGDTVGRAARLELVGEAQLQLTLSPHARVVSFADVAGRVPDQQGGGEIQQIGLPAPRLLPPGVEMRRRYDVGRNEPVVEGKQLLVIDQDVAAAYAVLELLEVLAELLIVVEESVLGRPVALDQRIPDEQLTRHLRIDPPVGDFAAGNERYTVKRDPLVGHYGPALLLPVRLAVGALHQMGGQRLRPFRVDAGDVAAPQPRSLDQLPGHRPARRFLGQCRPGPE